MVRTGQGVWLLLPTTALLVAVLAALLPRRLGQSDGSAGASSGRLSLPVLAARAAREAPSEPLESADQNEPSPPEGNVQLTPMQQAAAPGRTMTMRVTAYCPCRRCCGRWAGGPTASGRPVTTNGGRFIAADTDLLPFGTRVAVPGYHAGQPVPVLDRGGAIRGRRLDVFFPTHAQARQWGVREVLVTVCPK